MNVGSLFSGIGGFDYGLERAGMRVVWQCEQDEFCRQVLARHWPDVPCHEDVRLLVAEGHPAKDSLSVQVPPVDVLCGGFPCQDISLAGKGAGIDGARSGLWAEYARLVGELRPRYVIVENVSALLSRGLGRVLGDLAALGYDAEWDCIPASAVGAPHQRDRLWLVAYPTGSGRTDEQRVTDREALLGTVASAGGRDQHGDLAEGVRVATGASTSISGDVAYPERGGRPGRPEDARRGHPEWETAERREGAGEPAGRGATLGTDSHAQSIGRKRWLGQPVEEPCARTGQSTRAGGEGELADADRAAGSGAWSAAEAVSGSGTVERSGRRGGADGDLQDADECALLAWRVGGRTAQAGGSEWWAAEPPVGRVAHGVPDRLDQLAALGNALVPQIAEWLGGRILEWESSVTL